MKKEMMRKNRDDVVAFFEKSGMIRYETMFTGDYKTSNKEKPKLARAFRMFQDDPVFAMECISVMLESKNVVVRTDAAAYCLALKINIPLGEKVLEEISSDPANGIFGFNAKMTLKVWRENGELQMYRK